MSPLSFAIYFEEVPLRSMHTRTRRGLLNVTAHSTTPPRHTTSTKMLCKPSHSLRCLAATVTIRNIQNDISGDTYRAFRCSKPDRIVPKQLPGLNCCLGIDDRDETSGLAYLRRTFNSLASLLLHQQLSYILGTASLQVTDSISAACPEYRPFVITIRKKCHDKGTIRQDMDSVCPLPDR